MKDIILPIGKGHTVVIVEIYGTYSLSVKNPRDSFVTKKIFPEISGVAKHFSTAKELATALKKIDKFVNG